MKAVTLVNVVITLILIITVLVIYSGGNYSVIIFLLAVVLVLLWLSRFVAIPDDFLGYPRRSIDPGKYLASIIKEVTSKEGIRLVDLLVIRKDDEENKVIIEESEIGIFYRLHRGSFYDQQITTGLFEMGVEKSEGITKVELKSFKQKS